jgi:hypothetical protein
MLLSFVRCLWEAWTLNIWWERCADALRISAHHHNFH